MTPHAGPTDSLHDVPGLKVGSVGLEGMTGVTAVVAASSALGAVDVRGAAPGTRETDALSTSSSGERVHAVVLVGRSVFGLAAADGATRELESRGIGLPIASREAGRLTIPIVAAAVVFDFASGDGSVRPGPADGRDAVRAALDGPAERPGGGQVGAGTGAQVGGIVGERRAGGLGHASLVAELDDGRLVVGALVVVNSAGTPFRAGGGSPVAVRGGFDRPGPLPDFEPIASARGNTTLAVVGTNARLAKAQLGQVATMAHDGLARAIRPLHTGVDGDVVFALSTADRGDVVGVTAHEWGPAAVSIVGAMAADAATRAVLDAVGARRP
jgi:L-aminopeptidase/D-esterase-like protein